MKTVICRKTGSNTSISRNSVYTVIGETEKRYSLVNDKGIQRNYCKSLFADQNAVEERPAVVEPPAPVINTITELNIGVSTELDGETLRLNIELESNDGYLTIRDEIMLNVTGTSISCGVHQLYGLNGLFAQLNNIRTDINRVLTDTLVLADDINVDDTINTLLESILQDILETVPRTGVLLLSTNVSNNDHLRESYIEKLTDISSNTITTRNPNSNNDITLWTVVMNE